MNSSFCRKATVHFVDQPGIWLYREGKGRRGRKWSSVELTQYLTSQNDLF
jgi:hypothetical protein